MMPHALVRAEGSVQGHEDRRHGWARTCPPRRAASSFAFRSGETRWDGKRRQIVYTDRDLGEIRLSNGDRLMLGGYGIGSAASPDNVEVPIGPWIKEPDASCPARRWVVQQVVPQER